MAAANSDQENVLLQSDEGSPSAPLPRGGSRFKARLAVGICVFAAGLAGAVMMGRPAARAPTNIWHRWSAPTKIWHRWSAIGLSEHETHMTKECVDLLDELKKEATEQGRAHKVHWIAQPAGSPQDCNEESEQVCTMDVYMYGTYMTYEKCFPAVCKEENIFKDMEADFADAPPEAELSGLEVSCAAPGDEDTDGPSPTPSPTDPEPDHEFKHMTKECVDLLEALEKEAEEEGRTHQIDGPSGGTLDCKEDSEQACTFKFSMYGENIDSSKCFPAVCKEENIFKELEANMADVPPEAQLSGLEVSCAAPGSDVDEGTREPWAQYLSEECHDDLVKLEKEAEEEMRQHEGTAEDLDCKESDQTCIVSFTQMGQSFEMAKCFPAACKQQNIFKGLEEVMGGDALSQFSLPPVYQLTGLKISCSGGAEDAKSQAGQCGPEVGLLGASVLAASIFAQ